jgi:hypothetical protein
MLQDFFSPILLRRREDRTQATALKKGLNSYIVAVRPDEWGKLFYIFSMSRIGARHAATAGSRLTLLYVAYLSLFGHTAYPIRRSSIV